MIAPVGIVVLTGITALLISMLKRRQGNTTIVACSLIGLALAAYSVVVQMGQASGETFAQMVLRDPLSLALQLLLIVATALTLFFSDAYLREKRIVYGEFYPLILWSLSGAMIMVTTKNLLMLFVGLEILSVGLYVLAGLSKKEERSKESALKYFLLGAFASGFLLYGIAFVYGASGGMHLELIARAWDSNDQVFQNMLIFGLALILVGLGFKASLVPFHQWTPDVYQGAPTNVTAFMAAVSKIAAIAALYRVLEASEVMEQIWLPALFWIAIVTMTVGNLVALIQRDIKRTLGYSSIANAGYVLVALLAHFKDPERVGLSATVYYLIAYTLMTVGTFAVISLSAKNGREGTRFQDLYGLYKRSPLAAALLVVFVCSLIGVPPTAGFFGKLLIFSDALIADLTPLAILLAVNSVISIYYYLGIIRAAYVADEGYLDNKSARASFGTTSAAFLCAFGTIGAAVFLTPMMQWLGFGNSSADKASRIELPTPATYKGSEQVPNHGEVSAR